MGIHFVDTVFGYSKARGSKFTVFLGLADYANEETGTAYPSIGLLARKCRVSERTVNSAIKELVRLGEIEIVERGGYRYGKPRANTYRIKLKPNPQELHLGKSPNTQSTTPQHADTDSPNTQSTTSQHAQVAPQPSIEPSEEEPSEEKPPTENSEGDLFREWYDHYCESTSRQPERNTEKSRRLFDARRKEGHTLEELKGATRAACTDEWFMGNGKNVPIEILNANVIERLIMLDLDYQARGIYRVDAALSDDAVTEYDENGDPVFVS